MGAMIFVADNFKLKKSKRILVKEFTKMNKNKPLNLLNTIHSIICIDDNSDALSHILNKEDFHWEKLYKLASEHLMLPALHNAIYSKKLNALVPFDFLKATQHITDLNTNRNLKILSQIDKISQLFNTQNINYVYLKGTALLILNPYRAISDRMIGDIDMLINNGDLLKANQILLENGYQAAHSTPDPVYKNHRHLPRLISENEIAAVELHSRLFEMQQQCILPKDVISNKVQLKEHYIPSENHLYLNCILSHQVNDFNFLKWDVSLKTFYDCNVLIKQFSNLNKGFCYENKYVRRHWLIASLYFNNIEFSPNWIEKQKIIYLKWRKKHPFFNKTHNKLVFFYIRKNTFLIRAWYFVFNKAYRDYLLGKKE